MKCKWDCDICGDDNTKQCKKCERFFCPNHCVEWFFLNYESSMSICKSCFTAFRPHAEKIKAIAAKAEKEATELMKEFFGEGWIWDL